MRPFLAFIVTMPLLAAAFGCRQPPVPYRIGVSVGTMQEPVYAFMKDAIMEEAAKDGAKVYWLSAEHDEARQLADVENLVAQRVNALIVHAVNPGTASRLVKAAKDKHIPVVAMDRLPTNCPVDAYVTADSVAVGRLQAQYVINRLQGKGNVVILQGEAGHPVAAEITKGNKELLSQLPEMHIVADQAHRSWARDLALATVENALVATGNQIDAVLANNSGMAMGAVQALESKGLAGKVVTVGSDADKDAIASILAGKLSADVDKMPDALGRIAYHTAINLVHGRQPDVTTTIANGPYQVPVVNTPVKLIQPENVADMAYRWPDLPYPKQAAQP